MAKLVVELSTEAADNIADLQKRLRCKDTAEVLRNALALLDTAAKYADEGGYIFFKKPNGEVERLII